MNLRMNGCRDCQQLTSGDCGKHGPLTIPAVPLVASPAKQTNPCPVCGTFLWSDPRPCWNCARVASPAPVDEPERITTYTPILWTTLSPEQQYEEYIRVRGLAARPVSLVANDGPSDFDALLEHHQATERENSSLRKQIVGLAQDRASASVKPKDGHGSAAHPTSSSASLVATEEEFHEPPEGGRIVRIYRNGSWLEDSPAGHRKHYSWPDPDDISLVAPAEHFCVRCHLRWAGGDPMEYCGDCHRASLAGSLVEYRSVASLVAPKTPWTIDGSMPLPACLNDTVRRADVVTMWNEWRCGLPANAPFRHSVVRRILDELSRLRLASPPAPAKEK